MGSLAAAVRFAFEATGADRCSLVLRRPGGGSDLYAIDAEGEEHRELSIVPAQLFEHFDRHTDAEVHRDLASSQFESDRSLAKKGFAQVIRSPLREGSGRTVGILNVIRREARAEDPDREFVERFAAALSALVVTEGTRV
jgi:hypothetical protein